MCVPLSAHDLIMNPSFHLSNHQFICPFHLPGRLLELSLKKLAIKFGKSWNDLDDFKRIFWKLRSPIAGNNLKFFFVCQILQLPQNLHFTSFSESSLPRKCHSVTCLCNLSCRLSIPLDQSQMACENSPFTPTLEYYIFTLHLTLFKP